MLSEFAVIGFAAMGILVVIIDWAWLQPRYIRRLEARLVNQDDAALRLLAIELAATSEHNRKLCAEIMRLRS